MQMNKQHEEIQVEDIGYAYLQSGVDFVSRTIELNGEVNEAMTSHVVRSLTKMAEINPTAPIRIFLGSEGGSAYEAFAIYDAIKACPCEIQIIGVGKIMSAGFLIFLAADIRACFPHAIFMIHSIAYGSQGKLKDQQIEVDEARRLNNMMLTILGERTKQNKKYWYRQILSVDKYYNSEEANMLGITNAVFGSAKKKKVVRKKRKPIAKKRVVKRKKVRKKRK